MKSVGSTPNVLALIGCVALIFFSSTSLAERCAERIFDAIIQLRQDTSPYTVIHFVLEKSVHLILFVVLAVLSWRVIPPQPRKVTRILLFGTIIGCCSEVLQAFFPGRDPAMRDVFINMSGTGLGVAATVAVTTRRPG